MNSDKTTICETMICQKRAKITGQPPIMQVLDKTGKETTLKALEHTRILGMNIQRNLTWGAHLETGERALLPELRRKLGGLNHLSHHLPRKSRLILANGVIISRISYLIQIWGGCHEKYIKKSAISHEQDGKICSQS